MEDREDDLTLDDIDFDNISFEDEETTTEDDLEELSPWEDYDFTIESKFDTFIKQKKGFIDQFEKIRQGNSYAKTGEQQAIQDLIEEYHEILETLRTDKERVIESFSLGELNKSMLRHRKYPTEISKWHNSKALAWCFGIGSALAIPTLLYIGGGNPSLWSPELIWASAGIATAVGSAVAIPTRIRNWKKFDRNAVNSKKTNFIEKRIMQHVKEKERDFSKIALEINQHILEILKGEYSIHETKKVFRKRFIFFGKEKEHLVTDLKEEYKLFPKRKRKKLIKTINNFKKLNLTTENLKSKLSVYTNRQEEIQKREPQPIIQNPTTISEQSEIQKPKVLPTDTPPAEKGPPKKTKARIIYVKPQGGVEPTFGDDVSISFTSDKTFESLPQSKIDEIQEYAIAQAKKISKGRTSSEIEKLSEKYSSEASQRTLEPEVVLLSQMIASALNQIAAHLEKQQTIHPSNQNRVTAVARRIPKSNTTASSQDKSSHRKNRNNSKR